MEKKTLRPVREAALNGLVKVITAEWGTRCDRFETGCMCCMAWAVFDMMEKVTDGSALDDPDDYARVFNLDDDDSVVRSTEVGG